jgi:hypothetical protein
MSHRTVPHRHSRLGLAGLVAVFLGALVVTAPAADAGDFKISFGSIGPRIGYGYGNVWGYRQPKPVYHDQHAADRAHHKGWAHGKKAGYDAGYAAGYRGQLYCARFGGCFTRRSQHYIHAFREAYADAYRDGYRDGERARHAANCRWPRW